MISTCPDACSRKTEPLSPAAARQPECADLARVVGRVLLDVIPDVPDGAVVGRIHRGRRVVLPTHRGLNSLAFDQDRFLQRHLSWWIVGEPCCEALTGELRCSTIRVAKRDVAVAVDGRAGQPTEVAVGGVSPLL